MSSRGRTASPARRKSTASPARKATTSPRRGRSPKRAADVPAAAPEAPAAAPAAAHKPSPSKAHHHHKKVHVEFGGPVGAAAIMVFSHVLLYYVFCTLPRCESRPAHSDALADVLRINNGNIWYPTSMADLRGALAATIEKTAPTLCVRLPCPSLE